MKKFIFIILAIALLCTSSAGAFEAAGGIGAGVLIQSGHSATKTYHLALKIPLVTRDSAGYQILIEPSAVFSDRGLNNLTELEGTRWFAVGKKHMVGPLSAIIGIGMWVLVNSEGDNDEYTAATFGGRVKFLGVEVSLETDIVMLPKQKDLFYPHVSVRLAGF